jgi:hypothetical protein
MWIAWCNYVPHLHGAVVGYESRIDLKLVLFAPVHTCVAGSERYLHVLQEKGFTGKRGTIDPASDKQD